MRVMEDGQRYEARVVRKTKTGVIVERKVGNSTETWTVDLDQGIEVCKYRIMDVAGKRVLHNVGNTTHECTLSVMGAETVVVLRILITAHGRVDIMGNAGVEGVGEAHAQWVSTRSGSFLFVGRTRIARMEVLESNDQPESDAASALVSMRTRETALMEEREAAVEEREAAVEEREAALKEREAALEKREAAIAEMDDKIHNHWYGLKRKLEEAERRNLQMELERSKYVMSDAYARPHMNALAHSVSVLKEELSDLRKEIREAKRQRL